MTVSMFVFWPLAVTSGIGIAKQGMLPGRLHSQTAATLSTSSRSIPAAC